MAKTVIVTRVGKSQFRAATLMIKTKGKRARESRRRSLINHERIRSAHPGNLQTIFARRGEARKIGFVNGLVRLGSINEACVATLGQSPVKNNRAIRNVYNIEAARRRNRHFAHAAEV